MGLFSAIGDFFSRLFGLGEGALSNSSDKMLSASEGTIKAQFRKVKNDMEKNYKTVKDAVADLMTINKTKEQEIENLTKENKELETKKLGAVRKFKETEDPKYQEAFKNLHKKLEDNKAKIESEQNIIENNRVNIDKYKKHLGELRQKMEDLDRQESQAIADITTSRQVQQLNDRLSGISTDINMKGLNAIEEARKKAITQAELSSELHESVTNSTNLDEELLDAGSEVDDEFAKMLAEEEKKMEGVKTEESANNSTDNDSGERAL